MIEIKHAYINVFKIGGVGGGSPGNSAWLHIEFNNDRHIDLIFGTREEAEAELERIKRDGIKVWGAPAIMQKNNIILDILHQIGHKKQG